MVANIPDLRNVVILPFRMDKAESDRIHQLCAEIVAEQDRHKFLRLVEELNRILESQQQRLEDDKKSFRSAPWRSYELVIRSPRRRSKTEPEANLGKNVARATDFAEIKGSRAGHPIECDGDRLGKRNRYR